MDIASAFYQPDLQAVAASARERHGFREATLDVQPSDSSSGGGAGSESQTPVSRIGIRTDAAGKKVDDRAVLGEFVGTTFYGILFRQLRQSEFKGKYMHGGRGEEIFQAQLDQELAKRIGESPNDPLSNKVYEAYRKRLPDGAARREQGESAGAAVQGVTKFVDKTAAVSMYPRGIEIYRDMQSDANQIKLAEEASGAIAMPDPPQQPEEPS